LLDFKWQTISPQQVAGKTALLIIELPSEAKENPLIRVFDGQF
jgi:hypothetical protein